MNDEQKQQLKYQIRHAFRPSAPIDRQKLFAGRAKQTDMMVGAILQHGQHAILYGERGVGKTSMVKVLAEILTAAKIKTVNSDTINCDVKDDFSSLWHKAFRELTFKIKTGSTAFSQAEKETEQNLDEMVPDIVTPDDVRRALSTLGTKSVIIFDEFDRVQSPETRILMADTIKNLSDHTVDCTLILVGVAQSVVDLISEHKSIARALVEIPMPRMSKDELSQIIDMGLAGAKMSIALDVREKVVRLSHGLPHYTHLLSLESGLSALERDSITIEDQDFAKAFKQIVTTKQTVAEEYYSAVASANKSSNYKITLLACALSPIDGHGFFLAPDVAATLARLTQKKECAVSDIQRHLTDFVSSKRGQVLQRKGTVRKYRYRFSNPLVQPYTIIHSISEKLITEAQLWMMDQPFYG